MKFALVAALLGTAAVSASEQTATLRGAPAAPAASEYVYAPPPATESTSLAALWDELAAEAAFMQVQIAEGRSYSQCIDDCNNSNFEGNRARCERDCDDLDNTDRNSASCGCNRWQPNSRKWDRCKESCRAGTQDRVDDCRRAETCKECRLDCGTGIALDDCLDDLDCPGSDSRSNRSCSSANTCGQCNSFCDNNSDRRECRDDLNCSAEKEAAEEEIAKKLAEMVHKKEHKKE